MCWLALLLIRVAENTTTMTWRDLRRTVDRLHAITYTSAEGTIRTHTKPTSEAATIFRTLNLPTPLASSTPPPPRPPDNTPQRQPGTACLVTRRSPAQRRVHPSQNTHSRA